MSSEMRELVRAELRAARDTEDGVNRVMALLARTEAGADGEKGVNNPVWPLMDRVEFALRDAGFDYDEAFRIAHLAANPQDASGDAEDAAMFRWLCDNARPWESDYEQPHALIRICRGEFQGDVGWFNIIGRESRVGVITLRDAVRCAMQAKEAK